MEERRVSRRGPVATLRVVGGLIAIVAPFALGLLGHSPWKMLLLVPAFAASYALSRASRPDEPERDGSAIATIARLSSILIVQAIVAGSLYAVGLALGELFGDALPVDPLSGPDLVFVAIVWTVTLAIAATGRHLERHRPPAGPAP